MEVRVLSWNLYHGRDRAPGGSLHTWRSRLFGITEHGVTHAQVNRDLFDSFAGLLATAEWDLALLQECPPRWAERLARECGAEPHLVLTSRNLPPPLDSVQAAAARINPDLVASWEGGSNLTLVRSARPHRPRVSERRQLTLTRRPERRRMALTRLAGVCIANLHTSTERAAAEREIATAARAATAWAGRTPLILAGDLNLRSDAGAALFDQLERSFGLSGPTAPAAIDHILAAGLERLTPTEPWEPGRREVPEPPPTGTADRSRGALAVRLSDHSPVEAGFRLGGEAA